MQVDPARLVELATSSHSVLSAMASDWEDAQEDLSSACVGLGDAVGIKDFQLAYAESLADADQTVAALLNALEVGVVGLVDAARDALGADETVAAEIVRTTTSLQPVIYGPPPGHGGGR